MSRHDCAQTISPRAQSALTLLLALAWFALRRLGHGCGQAVEVWLMWAERAHQRRRLGELNEHMLRDIGLTRADAWAESEKPFWRP